MVDTFLTLTRSEIKQHNKENFQEKVILKEFKMEQELQPYWLSQ